MTFKWNGARVALPWSRNMISTTPLPENEEERLGFLRSLRILDTPIEDSFERITRLLCRVLDTPIAAISLVDQERQWFKSIKGLNVCQAPREGSFCAHAIMQDEPFVISDASTDPRFSENRFVTDEPQLRFYAGVPLAVTADVKIGVLFVCDTKSRQISDEDLQFLLDLAETTTGEIKTRLLKRMYV